MYYGMTKYSFDSDKPVYGPFQTREDAWKCILLMAEEEYRIDTEENDWESDIVKDATSGEITIKNYFWEGTDVTEFFIFEIV